MIEANFFLAAFVLQIVSMSMLCPALAIRHIRAQAATIPADRFEQVNPGIHLAQALEHTLFWYRAANATAIVLALMAFAWMYDYVQRPDWSDGPLETVAAASFMIQALPVLMLAVFGARSRKALGMLEPRRSAVLQRRGILNLVSPLTLVAAALTYGLFAGYVVYLARNPFPDFHPIATLIGVTLSYAMSAFAIHRLLYGRKANPFESHATRLRAMGLGVKGAVYAAIAGCVFLSLNFTLVVLDLQRWEPGAQSLFLALCALCCFAGFTAAPRGPTGTPDTGDEPARLGQEPL